MGRGASRAASKSPRTEANRVRSIEAGRTNSPKTRAEARGPDGSRLQRAVQRGDGTQTYGPAERRDANSRQVGGQRAMDFVDRSNAAARRSNRNARRRTRYAEGRAGVRRAGQRSSGRRSTGMSRDQVEGFLGNFYSEADLFNMGFRNYR